ncbi:MAG: hypothetical protein IV100_11940 [Myxococcales bacterium]|nr:hypothetical protein [Myxococcales bacterium]
MLRSHLLVVRVVFTAAVALGIGCGEDAKLIGNLEPGDDVAATDDTATADGTDGTDGTDGGTPVGTPCQSPTDCKAVTPACQKPLCSAGVCATEPVLEGAPCSTGDKCVLAERCVSGECTGGTPKPCDDGDLCTADSCGPDGTCQHVPAAGGCDDKNPCTIGDFCVDGACKAGNNACPCIKTDDCKKYDPGDPCVGAFSCVTGSCQITPGTASVCPTGAVNACNLHGCVEGNGSCAAIPVSKGTACDDGDPCTLGDACQAGVCQPGDRQCPCSADADCEVYEDGDRCNGTLVCKNGQCLLASASVVSCIDPGNPCAAVACDPATGDCVETPSDGQGCSDGDACTTGDRCDGGTCQGNPTVCNDQNPCTTDSCGADGACQYSPLTGPCDDGNECTKDDLCTAGTCTPGADVCSCTSDADCTQFDDGDSCNGTLVCLGQKCTIKLGSALVCPPGSGSECAIPSCKNSACTTEPVNEGLPCNDADVCTDGETCIAGVCGGGTDTCSCQPIAEKYLQCGAKKSSWSNAAFGATDAIDGWDCAAGDFSAKEYAWPFFTNKPVKVTMKLLNESATTQLFLLRDSGAGCAPASCTKSHPSLLTFVALPDEKIIVVVDGKDGKVGTFDYEVSCDSAIEVLCDNGADEDSDGDTDCNDEDCADDVYCSTPEDCTNQLDDDNDGKTDCADPNCASGALCQTLCTSSTQMYCGFGQGWDTIGEDDSVSNYSCATGLSGPDFYYRFNPTATDFVTLEMPKSFFGVNLVVIEHKDGVCNGQNCLASGPPPLTFTAFAGSTYYVGVDGQAGAQGSYELKVVCGFPE